MRNKRSWLAGIVDGEGCIQIVRMWRRTDYSYRPEIHITNTNKLILNETSKLIEIITGKKTKMFPTKNGNPKIVYRVRLQDKNSCLALIKSLLPFLIGKRKQAIILLEYLKAKSSNRKIKAMQAARIRRINSGSSHQEPQRLNAKPQVRG